MIELDKARMNEAEIEALTECLREAFNTYCGDESRQDNPIQFVDALMALHRFHAQAIFDMEVAVGLDVNHQQFWRGAMIDAFTRVLRR